MIKKINKGLILHWNIQSLNDDLDVGNALNIFYNEVLEADLLSFTTINFRIRKLKKEKIIRKVMIDLDREKKGLLILAFINVTVEYKVAGSSKTLEQDEIAKDIKKIPGVQEAMLMTGGTDLLVKVLASGVKELNQIVIKKMRKVAGVDKTQTSIVLQEV